MQPNINQNEPALKKRKIDLTINSDDDVNEAQEVEVIEISSDDDDVRPTVRCDGVSSSVADHSTSLNDIKGCLKTDSNDHIGTSLNDSKGCLKTDSNRHNS